MTHASGAAAGPAQAPVHYRAVSSDSLCSNMAPPGRTWTHACAWRAHPSAAPQHPAVYVGGAWAARAQNTLRSANTNPAIQHSQETLSSSLTPRLKCCTSSSAPQYRLAQVKQKETPSLQEMACNPDCMTKAFLHLTELRTKAYLCDYLFNKTGNYTGYQKQGTATTSASHRLRLNPEWGKWEAENFW